MYKKVKIKNKTKQNKPPKLLHLTIQPKMLGIKSVGREDSKYFRICDYQFEIVFCFLEIVENLSIAIRVILLETWNRY